MASAPQADTLISLVFTSSEEAFAAGWAKWRAGNPVVAEVSEPDKKLLPMVWRRVLKLGIPDPDAAGFSVTVRQAWMRNEQVLNQCAAIQAHLAAKGIQSVAFKGTALCSNVYARVSDRPTSDIDLWVSASSFRNAIRDLRAERPSVLRSWHAAALSGPDVCELDLHTLPAQFSRVMPRAQSVALEASVMANAQASAHPKKVCVPTVTDTIFLQLLNNFSHSLSGDEDGGQWLVDLVFTARHDAFDLNALTQRIQSTDAAGLIAHRIDTWNGPVPSEIDGVMHTLSSLPQTAFDARVYAAFKTVDAETQPDDSFRALWFAMRGDPDERFINRMKYVFACAVDFLGSVWLSRSISDAPVESTTHYISKLASALRPKSWGQGS